MFAFVLGVVAGLIANHVSPAFNRATEAGLSWVFHLLNAERFDLTGTWEQTFEEPFPGAEVTPRNVVERVTVRHLGSTISAKGVTEVEPRTFLYKLKVQHNLVFGSYTKLGARGNITGNGMIQLVVSPDRLSMQGQATWFDGDTSQIESSVSKWKKIA